MHDRERASEYFLTLTYPAERTCDANLWNGISKFSHNDLRAGFQGPVSNADFIWKLEFQERSAPHFHPFVWGIAESDGLREIIDFISKAWFEVVASGDEKHFIAGTRVEKMRSVTAAAVRYVSGYASKKDQTLRGKNVGRYWGVVRKQTFRGVRRKQSSLMNDSQK